MAGGVYHDSHSRPGEAAWIFALNSEPFVCEPLAGGAAPSRLPVQKRNGLITSSADLLSSAFKCAFTGMLYKSNELIFSKSKPLKNDWLRLKHFQLYSIIA